MRVTTEADRASASRTVGPRLAPEITVEATARSFFKLALGYGFGLGDFVRFVDVLLGIAMTRKGAREVPLAGSTPVQKRFRALPIAGELVTIRSFGDPPPVERG